MVDVNGFGVSEFTREAGEMARRKVPSPTPLSSGLPAEEPAWTRTDLMIVPVSARLELPMAGMSRYDLRRMGELVEQLGAMMVRLSHQHALSERSIMFEVCNAVRATQHHLGPVRRAKRKTVRDGIGDE